MKKRAVAYARSATEEQDTPSRIAEQKRAIAAYCGQMGWVTMGEYVDVGASGANDNRPQFQRMMEDARAGAFDVVVVESYSRFFRDLVLAEVHRRLLKKTGVDLVAVTEETGHAPSPHFMRQFIALFDEHVAKIKAQHILRAMKENARQGFVSGVPPFGYRAVTVEVRGSQAKKRLEIEPYEAEIVRLIFNMASVKVPGAPPGNVPTIIRELHDRNLVTRAGRPFSARAVRHILYQTVYIGRYVFNRCERTGKEKPRDEWITISIPPIVDEASFWALQAKLRRQFPGDSE